MQRATTRRPSRARAASLATLVLLAGCTVGDGPGDEAVPGAAQEGASGGQRPDAGPAPDAPLAVPDVEIDGDRLLLVDPDGTRMTVAELQTHEELLHATVRPGDLEPITVLALTRAEDRYELRYLNVLDGEVSDLFWFPWRMQVAEDVVAVADVPTLPVWAPDGSALAWLEWDDAGTRLRTVEWVDHDTAGNPSDDQAAYRLAEVPVGSQLVAWERDDDGTPVLRARGEGRQIWRIRLEEGAPVAALEAPPGAGRGEGTELIPA